MKKKQTPYKVQCYYGPGQPPHGPLASCSRRLLWVTRHFSVAESKVYISCCKNRTGNEAKHHSVGNLHAAVGQSYQLIGTGIQASAEDVEEHRSCLTGAKLAPVSQPPSSTSLAASASNLSLCEAKEHSVQSPQILPYQNKG